MATQSTEICKRSLRCMNVILRSMKIAEWLKQAEMKLTEAGIGSAQLDALILLEDELGKDRAHLLAHPEIILETPAQGYTLCRLEAKLERRLKHEPMAYIRSFSEFYGRNFKIDKRVLEPRVESEAMIELLLNLNLPAAPQIADIGTGSGALAITAKLELPEAQVLATEIDKAALEVAKQNAKELGADIKFLQGDLLQPLLSTNYYLPTTILANLPYVPNNWQINEAAAMEPRVAIFGGVDGLDLYRRLFGQISARAHMPQFVLTESLPPQHQKLSDIAASHQYKLHKSNDFIQVFKLSKVKTK